MGRLTHLKALMWKNWKLRIRSRLSTVFELGIPMLLGVYIFYSRQQATITVVEPKVYRASSSVFDEFSHYLESPNASAISFAWHNLTLSYYPKSPASDTLMQYIPSYMKDVGTFVLGYDSVEEAYAADRNYEIPNPSTIIFEDLAFNSTEVPQNLRVKLLSDDSSLNTREHFQFGDSELDTYQSGTILGAQKLAAEIFVNYWRAQEGQNDTVSFNLKTQLMPTPGKLISSFDFYLNKLGDVITLCFLVTAGTTCIAIVRERESKLKESMKLMGVTTGVYWLSWVCWGTFSFSTVALILLIIFYIPGSEGAILESTSPLVMALILIIYSFNSLSYGILSTCFMKKASSTAVFCSVTVIVLKAFASLVLTPHTPPLVKILLGVPLFQIGFSSAINATIEKEKNGNGYTLATMNEPFSEDLHYSLVFDLLIMFLNTIFNTIMVWYLDHIHPGEIGIAQPYYFCLQWSFWFPNAKQQEIEHQPPKQDETYFEAPPENLKPGIRLQNLGKMFGSHVAVAEMTLDIYEDQITILLGHNGAGKTTTMAMITGFIQPTCGKAIVNGYDVATDLERARQSLGLCPQHDILFDYLTCKEHLQFYCLLKGMKGNLEEVSEILRGLTMDDQMGTMPKVLSGGQRRKLSVAAALIGNPKVVVLDEPSAELDPDARRQLWTFLKFVRHGRTMLLTTQHMGDADALGDRIAIMAKGKVKCCGSPMFLKKIYGAGYQLRMVKAQTCDVKKVTNIIQSKIPTAEFRGSSIGEIHYHLPEATVRQFPALLLDLERHSDLYNIKSYGLTATTMEEVFMKVGYGYEPVLLRDDRDEREAKSVEIRKKIGNFRGEKLAPEPMDDNGTDVDILSAMRGGSHRGSVDSSSRVRTERSPCKSYDSRMDTAPPSDQSSSADGLVMGFRSDFIPLYYQNNTGLCLQAQQMMGIFIKKVHFTRRSWMTTLLQVVLPSFLVIIGIHFDQQPSVGAQSPLRYSLMPFEESHVFVFHGEDLPAEVVKEYMRLVVALGRKFIVQPVEVTENFDINDFYVRTMKEMGIHDYERKLVVGALFLNKSGYLETTVFYSMKARHSVAISTDLVLNALVKQELGHQFSIETGVMPIGVVEEKKPHLYMFTMVTLSLGMAILPAVFIHVLIVEREIGARHLQAVSGISSLTYWLPTYLCDMLVYSVAVLGLMLSFCYDPESHIADRGWEITLFLLFIFGLAMFPNIYAWQLLFRNPAKGVAVVFLFNISTGVFGAYYVTFKKLGMHEMESFLATIELLLLTLSPIYALSVAILNVSLLISFLKIESFDGYFSDAYFQNVNIGLAKPASVLVGQMFCSLLVIFFVEYKIPRKIRYTFGAKMSVLPGSPNEENGRNSIEMEEDSDVEEERERINETNTTELCRQDALVLKNLVKAYGNLVAVKGACVGIPERECFGLLGQNGAGKSTIFKMLTGEIPVSGGDAFLKGNSIRDNLARVRSSMSYCPQPDALHDNLTVHETLYLYGRLRGVPEQVLEAVVRQFILYLSLVPHADKLISTLSGGIKRKLSVAVALIGNPSFILLDEPALGLDPEERQVLWRILHTARALGRTLVMTSHSMEDCEALCTRIAIQVAGSFKCLGTPQHLKTKFGQGYTITVGLKSMDSEIADRVEQAVETTLRGSTVFERQDRYIYFQVPASYELSQVFEKMQKLKEGNPYIDMYTVQQATLEQIFLAFVRGADMAAIARANRRRPSLFPHYQRFSIFPS